MATGNAGTSGDGANGCLGRALRFSTWRSLQQEGLGDRQIADLLLRWLQAA